MTDFTPARLAELRAVAEAATNSAWEQDEDLPEAVCASWNGRHWYMDAVHEEDATHISAFDPPTVLSLIAALETKTAEVERLREVEKMLAESERANETYAGIEGELMELKQTLTELAPSAAIVPTEEVVIDGDVFTWGDLPDVLRRTRESLAETQRADRAEAAREELQGVLERVRAVRSFAPECDKYDDDSPIVCGWKRTVQSIDAVLEAGADDD